MLPSCLAVRSLSIGRLAHRCTRGVVTRFILTGNSDGSGIYRDDWNYAGDMPESHVIAQHLVNAGVPGDSLIIEDRSTHSLENVLFAMEKTNFSTFRSILVITGVTPPVDSFERSSGTSPIRQLSTRFRSQRKSMTLRPGASPAAHSTGRTGPRPNSPPVWCLLRTDESSHTAGSVVWYRLIRYLAYRMSERARWVVA